MKRIPLLIAALATLGSGSAVARGAADSIHFDVGFGWGIHYGLVGANAELFLTDKASISIGAGRGYDFAYDVGTNYYFFDNPLKWRPRVSLNYGTFDQYRTPSNNSSFFSDNNSGRTSFETFSVGAGIKKMWGPDGSNGFAFDLSYSFRSAPANYPGLNRVRPSIGYIHRF
jgi:hypothetical protein